LTLASVLDISQRKASELEASRQRDQLARVARVAMLGELSGALAHELNQPLSAILGNAQAAQRFLMREPPQVDTVREILADIVGSGRRAAEVIARVRSLIRNDEPPQHALDPDQLVAEVLALMRNDLAAREVVVRTELAADLPRLRGDRVQLQQLLLNLLLNACDAMADAPAPRVILIDTVQSGPGRILIRIKDAGPGILDGELERIFEPFVTTKRDGLGLGLALCRTIVRAHDGRIWAGNHPDGGAILHVELPAPRA
jgi:C4-dicarboxylate-specific signal transduction histidine kinase